jgi:hypothetical protein
MDRCKNMCFHIVPVYYGERPSSTRGKPNESKDYYFQCYVSANKREADYRRANTINDLCNDCKNYLYIKPLTKEEIKEQYYNGKSREVMVVSQTGWYFKEI